jgi:putative flippase GtrA
MSGAGGWRRVVTFGSVGLGAACVYFLIAWALSTQGVLPASVASFIAYLASAGFSYLGHKALTFRSSAPHRRELPRFALAGALGYAIAVIVPLVLTDFWRFQPVIAIVIVCIAVPVVNFLLLTFFVFKADGLRGGASV